MKEQGEANGQEAEETKLETDWTTPDTRPKLKPNPMLSGCATRENGVTLLVNISSVSVVSLTFVSVSVRFTAECRTLIEHFTSGHRVSECRIRKGTGNAVELRYDEGASTPQTAFVYEDQQEHGFMNCLVLSSRCKSERKSVIKTL